MRKIKNETNDLLDNRLSNTEKLSLSDQVNDLSQVTQAIINALGYTSDMKYYS